MKGIGAARFKEQCLALLERLVPDGLVITKHGKPIATVHPYARTSADRIGCLEGKIARLAQIELVRTDLDAPEFARASTRIDFRGDPVDEIIAATSVVHGSPLVTRDRRIRCSKRVPLALV